MAGMASVSFLEKVSVRSLRLPSLTTLSSTDTVLSRGLILVLFDLVFNALATTSGVRKTLRNDDG